MEHGLGCADAAIPPPNGTDFRRVPVTGTPEALLRNSAKVSPRHRNFPQAAAGQRVKVRVPSAATSGESSGNASASLSASANAASCVGRAAASSAWPAGVTSV
jgi:hypothetical protein